MSGLVGLFFVSALEAGKHKPLWFDEMFTLIVAMQPDRHHFAQAMVAEGNPPLHALLARVCLHLFGMHAYALRMPDTLGICGAAIGLYIFIRRERDALLGLLAVVLFLGQPVWHYAFEARPYGLLLAFTMMALVCWQAAVHTQQRRYPSTRVLALAGLALAILGATFSHYIGVLNVMIPLVFGEGFRTLRTRRFDGPLIAVAGCASMSFLWILPMMHRTKAVIVNRSNLDISAVLQHPGAYLESIEASWRLLFSPGPLLLLVIVVALTSSATQRVSGTCEVDESVFSSDATSSYALAAALGAALLIPLAWLVMLSARGYFFCRYGIASSLGVPMLAGLLMARHSPAQKQQALLTLVFFAFLTGKFIQVDLSSRPVTPEAQFQAVYSAGGDQPVVVADPLSFPTLWWYAPASVKARVVYLTGIASQHPEFGQNILDADLTAEKGLFPAQIVDENVFLTSHSKFLLYDSTPNSLMKQAVQKRGCQVLNRPNAGGTTDFYEVDCAQAAFS